MSSERDVRRGFATTRWSLVLSAQRRDGGAHRAALEDLCRAYWYPLYAYVRRRGHAVDDAHDLTQSFFARFLEKDFLGDVERDRGRFRAFLLASLKHFLANERDRLRALKRGGGRTKLSLDLERAEDRYGLEPSHQQTPEAIFERRWALTILERALARLRETYAADSRPELFAVLESRLTGGDSPETYRHLAERLSMTEGAVKVALHRLRKRYRDCLRREVAETVRDAADVDGEIRHLMDALSG